MAEIRFKRGTSNKIEQNKKRELAYGQPLFNSDKNYLTIGNKENKNYDIQPIVTRELHGWASDDDSIKALSTSTEEYYIKPETIKYFNSSNKEKSLNIFSDVGENNKSIALSVKYNNGNKQSIKPAIYIKNETSKAQDNLNINIYGDNIDLGESTNNSVINIHGIIDIKGQVKLSNVLSADITSLTVDKIKNKAEVEKGLTLKDTTTLSGNITNGSSLYIRNSDTEKTPALQSNYATIKNLTATNINANKVEASYFNAKSDRRLKEDIFDSNINALDIVNSIDIKEYNFKEGNRERQLGIIAQDLLEQDKDKFFIDNSDEYLRVKENKLIYLLWKAIQELSNKVGE